MMITQNKTKILSSTKQVILTYRATNHRVSHKEPRVLNGSRGVAMLLPILVEQSLTFTGMLWEAS